MTDVDRKTKTKNIVVRCLRPYKGYGLLRERDSLFSSYIGGLTICGGDGQGMLESGSSAVECRTLNRESPGLNPPIATVSKTGHFNYRHDASVHSVV